MELAWAGYCLWQDWRSQIALEACCIDVCDFFLSWQLWFAYTVATVVFVGSARAQWTLWSWSVIWLLDGTDLFIITIPGFRCCITCLARDLCFSWSSSQDILGVPVVDLVFWGHFLFVIPQECRRGHLLLSVGYLERSHVVRASSGLLYLSFGLLVVGDRESSDSLWLQCDASQTSSVNWALYELMKGRAVSSTPPSELFCVDLVHGLVGRETGLLDDE
jgi:hypothetical protein